MGKTTFLAVKKNWYKLPKLGGGGGGEVIWAMPERNRFFLWEVFPNVMNIFLENFYK